MSLTAAELDDHLVEQVGFIDASCRGYDEGQRAEAKRLATTIRVLVHDTDKNVSLLHLMGVKNKLAYLDGAKHLPKPNPPAQILTQSGIAGLAVVAMRGSGATFYVPAYEAGGVDPNTSTTFDIWWETPTCHDIKGNAFSRRHFILWLANKDGGAHVDSKLPPTYHQLVRENSMGWVSPDPADHPAHACARQIAEELRSTLRAEWPNLLGPNPTPPKRPPGVHILGAQLVHDPSQT